MNHVTILALKNSNMASIVDARAIFTKVNELLGNSGHKKVFDIQVAGMTNDNRVSENIFSIKPEILIDRITRTDLIIIPALIGDMMTATYNNRFYVDWIVKQYKKNAEIASLCTGSFMLAYSGLLKNKKCTTHWQYANEFRHIYPNVELIDEKIIVEHNGLYSSGGNNAYWNLFLFLIEKYVNREMAIQIAKYFVVNMDKVSQTPFIIFNGLKDHEDEEILKSQEYIEQNYQQKITVDDLAAKLHLTRRTLERRFKKCTHCTVIEYLQKVRVEVSKKELEIGRKSIDEILTDVGYSDPQAFRDIFKRVTGTTPIDYKNRYTKN